MPNLRPVRLSRNTNKDGHTKVSVNPLEMLVTVVNRSKADFYMDLIHGFGANMQMLVFGHGTANKEMLGMLGLADSQRAVIFSMVGAEKLPQLLDTIEEKFNTIPDGKGIAYTIPMSSIIGVNIFNFLSDNREQVLAKEGK